MVGFAAAGMLVVQRPPARVPGQPAPLPIEINDGTRIRYPEGHYPTLTLLDGRRRVLHSLLSSPGPLRYGDYLWNEAGIAADEVWVRVDLPRQTLSVFRGHDEIGSAVILYGTDGKPTPTGTFPILARAAKHRSSLYDAEMPFMLRLTNDGVAIHASDVRDGVATHGCIGVPEDFARLLFAQARVGDLVTIIG